MRRGGYTLLEVLIAAFLGGMLMTAVTQFFVTSARIYKHSEDRIDLQATGLLAASNVVQDLRQSALATVTITQTPAAIAFQPGSIASAFTPDSYFILYYYDPVQGVLMRKTWPAIPNEPFGINPTPMDQNRRLLATEVAGVVGAPNGTERKIAAHVKAVRFVPAKFPDPTLTNVLLQVDVTMHLDTPPTSGIDEEAFASVFMRNQPQVPNR